MKEQNDIEDLVIVDGHNFIFNILKGVRPGSEKLTYLKEKLVADLDLYKNQKNCDMVVVFDARNSDNPSRSIQIIDGVKVIYSRKNETADDIIEELAGMESDYRRKFVVTSDYLQQKVVFGKNIYRKSSREFNLEIKDLKERIREKITRSREDSDKKFHSLEKRLSGKERKKLSELRKK
ncbi:MAG: NYN domain-containing protein [Actinomycetota bacterium]|nr:NYN domain-containing protein [Actinomycetota bacterium]